VRSYQQYCAVARGLDVIGDRWVLLIVRELLHGPRRFGELSDGLPGIASNLLAERLRTMAANALLVRTNDDRYRLSDRGLALGDVLTAIGRWAQPLMGAIGPDDTFRSRWIAHPIADMFAGVDPTRPELSVEVRCGDGPVTIHSTDGRVFVEPGHAAAPDVVLTGPPDLTIGLIAHHVTLAQAKAAGVAITGNTRLLRQLKPTAPRPSNPSKGQNQ
jgi:DNA-binding HxlR family transcriptional regulator